jgi:hypothetical protein
MSRSLLPGTGVCPIMRQERGSGKFTAQRKRPAGAEPGALEMSMAYKARYQLSLIYREVL